MERGFLYRLAKDWEQTRLIAYNILAVNRNPKKYFPSITEYLPLYTDEDSKENDGDREKKLLEVMRKHKSGELYNLPVK